MTTTGNITTGGQVHIGTKATTTWIPACGTSLRSRFRQTAAEVTCTKCLKLVK